MKASPAPSTLKTSTGKPGPREAVVERRRGSRRRSTTQPIGPRFTTSVACVSARRRRSAARVSALPPAMRISSSVPTTRSQCGSDRAAASRLTRVGLDVALLAQSPAAVSPHSTGR